MGLFLALSGIAACDAQDIQKCLKNYVASKSGKFEPAASGTDDEDTLIIAEAPGKNVTVMYPGNFFEWDEASAFLSSALKKPVFSLHIHDGDLWMFILFVDGKAISHFNPLPEYWDDNISDEERAFWSGNAAIVCQHWPGITVEKIQNYLVHWSLDELGAQEARKAYPDDEFAVGQDWQLCDFMKKLGLVYPMDANGNSIGSSFKFSLPEPRNNLP